jgi:hypothetical protein
MAKLHQAVLLPQGKLQARTQTLLRGPVVSLLDRFRQFFSDIQRIREALERINPPNQPRDPRRTVYRP